MSATGSSKVIDDPEQMKDGRITKMKPIPCFDILLERITACRAADDHGQDREQDWIRPETDPDHVTTRYLV
jgi:hypothetical protein